MLYTYIHELLFLKNLELEIPVPIFNIDLAKQGKTTLL